MTLYYLPQYKTTTLATPGGINASTTSGITLQDVTGVDTTKPGIICVSYTNPLNTDNAEFITYTSIDGTKTLVGATRAQEGISAKTHSNGVTVAFVVSKSHINLLNDLLTGVTEGIKVKTSLQDVNGNEVIKTPATTNAVNEFTVTNTATGNDPTLSATGDDSNIGIKLTPKGTGKVQVTANDLSIPTGGNIQENGADPSRTIVIPSAAMSPTTTSGCASVATVEAGTNDVDYKVLDFDQTTEENAFFLLAMPDSWDGGTLVAKFIWTTAASSGNVIWGLKGRSFADDAAIDQAYGTAQEVTDGFLAAGDVHISGATSALTLAGSPAGGQMVQFKVYRKAADGSDTLNGDARLIGIILEYKVAQFSD